jgi:hypothetical protein
MNKTQHVRFAKRKHLKQLKRNAKKKRARIHRLNLEQGEKRRDREEAESGGSDLIDLI